VVDDGIKDDEPNTQIGRSCSLTALR